VEGLFSIRTIGQVLANSGGVVDTYASPTYIRRVVFETEQSDYDGGYEIYHSSYYPAYAGMIFYGNGVYYRARENSRIDDIGLGVTEAVELEQPIFSFTYQPGGNTYNSTTDTYTPPPNKGSIFCFVEKLLLNFQHTALGFVRVEEGDKAISFLKSAIPASQPGDTIGHYRIMSVVDMGTFWTAHGRSSAANPVVPVPTP
jgi:hypothetical protein